ncbi:MAG TPA: tetratricopeptide repeat protein [Methylotenera sp.]|nr:tetratricopeptide repeat protein [Methylotenera sp.]
MMKKPGRNDPCPCGSGKKYKQCCQQAETASASNVPSLELQIRQAMQNAWAHRNRGNLAQAESICHQIIQLAPKNADALNLLGALMMQDGRIDLAATYFNQAIRNNPKNPEFYSNFGLALHEQGQLDAAEVHYRKAIAIDPGYADAYYNLHALLLNSKDMAPAIKCMTKVVELSPLDTDARFILGVLLDYAGEVAAAENHFDIVSKSSNLFRARLDAWRYIKSASKTLPRITGSGNETFKFALSVANPDGLVLEFGVRFGTSIRQIAAMVNQPVHGFDSFEGLPEVWHHEPKGSYTTKGVIPAVPENVSLHVGWFEDTLPKFLKQNFEPVRFINIDCDIYSSTVTILEQLAPRMVVGSVIVFDEYIGNERWREDEFKALQEAVAKYGWIYEYICFSVFTKQVGIRITKV